MNDQLKNYILLHVTVFIFGFTAILGKLITLESAQLVWQRVLIGATGILIYALVKKRPLVPHWKDLLKFIGTGIIIAAHWTTFFESVKVSTVSITLGCISSATLFVAFIEPWMYKRPLKLCEIVLGVFIIFGLLIIFKVETEYQLGILLSVIAAFLAALFSTINGVLVQRQKHPPLVVSVYELYGGCLGLTIYMLFTGELDESLFRFQGDDLMWMLVLAIICTSFAFVASNEVMKTLSPFTVTLSINLEPVYGIVLAYLIFGESEKMSPAFYVGAGIIIAALFVNAILKRRERKKQKRLQTEAPSNQV